MRYNPQILDEFARRLENKADLIVTLSVIVGILIGAAILGFKRSALGWS